MACQNVSRWIHLLFLSLTITNLALCTRYSNYTEYSMENENICRIKPLGKRSKLPSIRDSAILIKANHMFDRWDVIHDVECRFVIKTSNKGDGLFAVIQKMSFRRHNETHCLDYVQFRRSDNYRTEKFCGQIDRSKTRYYAVPEPENSSYELGSLSNIYAEFDYNRAGSQLETEIFISKKRLEPNERLDLSIVYTPYKNCSKVSLDEYKPIINSTCMAKAYFCDDYQNCIPNFCLDEKDCPNYPTIINSTGTGTNVTVGAVTTIILVFIIFCMCLWICKRHERLCWSDDCAGPNVCSTRSGALSQEPEASSNPPVPTAPMLEVAVTPSVLDKDLPPSYDSLFPPQSNTATS